MLSDKFCHLSKQQLLINRSINSKRSRNLRHFYNMKMGRDLFSHFQIIKQPDVINLYTYLDIGMDPALYAKDNARAVAWTARLPAAREELDAAETRWLELSERA